MTDLLQGTVALVTGASSGIGDATAAALAAEGAAVVVVARRRDRLDALAERIRGSGGTAAVIEADVTERASAEEAVAGAIRAFGRLDVVVNNAGVMLLGPAVDAPMEEWDRIARSGRAVYNATKWGVNAFSESLRQEVTSRDVRIGLIEP